MELFFSLAPFFIKIIKRKGGGEKDVDEEI